MAIRKSEEEFNATSVFNMLEERYRNGHCLGTVATGTLSDVEAERTGLVPTHAYAILNIKTVKVRLPGFELTLDVDVDISTILPFLSLPLPL